MTVAIIGAGPRTVGLLERLTAVAGRPLTFPVHIIDPEVAGCGRIWRPDQSRLLWMNSRAHEVTMFTDGSVTGAGPVLPGPDMATWLGTVDREAFPSRSTTGEYLRWCFQRALAAIPSAVVHRASAIRLTRTRDNRQHITLSTGGRIIADTVVLAQGGLAGGPAHGPGPTDPTGLPGGDEVAVAGLGLTFFDLMVQVTEGRGGRFERDPHGSLRYHPSGSEPVLLVGSRRGLPAVPKPRAGLITTSHDEPRYCTTRALRGADATGILALLTKELALAYYAELFAAHPQRTTMSWTRFRARYDNAGDDAAGLVARAVPSPADRFLLDRRDLTLTGETFDRPATLDHRVRTRLRAAVRRAVSPAETAWQAIYPATVAIAGDVIGLLASGADPAPMAPLMKLMTLLGSGPPPYRLEQLDALAGAGLVRFLGAGLSVTSDSARDGYVAVSASHPWTITTRHFVRAWLPATDARTDPLLADLISTEGAVTDAARIRVDGATYQLLNASGGSDPDRIALGAFASGGALGSLPRPGTDDPFFRQNAAAARWIIARYGWPEAARPEPAAATG